MKSMRSIIISMVNHHRIFRIIRSGVPDALRPTAPNITNPFATPAANHSHNNPADADNDNPDVDNDDNFSVTSEVAATARQLMGGDSSKGDSHDEDDDNVSKDAGKGDEFSTLVIPENDDFLRPLASDRCINLLEVNQFETQTFRHLRRAI